MALTTYEELQAELQERMPALAPGQRRIATVLLSDPEGTALRSIAETAEIAGVNQSSLVRFATMLGLKGYPALVRLCREHLSGQANLVSRFERAQEHTGQGSLFAAVLEHEKDNLTRSYARIAQADWDQAVKTLAEAPAVYVMGLRKCAPIAQLLGYLLRLVRRRVEQIRLRPACSSTSSATSTRRGPSWPSRSAATPPTPSAPSNTPSAVVSQRSH
ncbi:MurR/RpiR family transcriptional regulator [Sinomonas atrocyanea]